jgi:hypothetical protein
VCGVCVCVCVFVYVFVFVVCVCVCGGCIEGVPPLLHNQCCVYASVGGACSCVHESAYTDGCQIVGGKEEADHTLRFRHDVATRDRWRDVRRLTCLKTFFCRGTAGPNFQLMRSSQVAILA